MNYRSIADTSKIIRANLWRVPDDIDLVVGVPRSGMLVAPMVALPFNLNFCDLNALLDNKTLGSGQTRHIKHQHIHRTQDAKKILIVDDSVSSGASMQRTKAALAKIPKHIEITYLAIYADRKGKKFVDLYFELLPQPRYFEWNWLHREESESFCYNIDGIFLANCVSTSGEEGERPLRPISKTRPLLIPSQPLGHLISDLPEAARPEIENWLKRYHFQFKQLHMLGSSSADLDQDAQRQAKRKAEIFRSLAESRLFIESDSSQAFEIARLSGKHVLDYPNQTLIGPETNFVGVSEFVKHDVFHRVKSKLMRMIGAGHTR